MKYLARFAVFASVLAFAAPATRSHADTIFFNTPTTYVGNECCFQVDLHSVSATQMQVTVSLLNGATFFVGTGAGQHPTFSFNLTGHPSVLISGYNTTDWTASSASVATNGPDLGTFGYQLNLNSSGASGKISTLLFDVTNASGIGFADFVTNAAGNYFVADILGSDGNTGLSAINDPGTPSTVPEPSSLLLLGTGITGAGILLRQKISRGIAQLRA